MAVRDGIIELLERGRGEFISGQEIARELRVSRAAVWKAVRALNGGGYAIEAVSGRGYRLPGSADVLSAKGIAKHLPPDCPALDIEVIKEATSTNALVRESAERGAPEGHVIIALGQSAGRGRLGRGFFAPPGTGIYMSVLLRPEGWPASEAVKLTTMAAVAVCEAVERVSGGEARIKWVNDVFMRGKKICGILTEGAFGLENGLLDYAVVGVGINVYEPPGGFPKELEGVAGAVLPRPLGDAKNRIAAAFLSGFMGYYTTPGHADYAVKYRERSLVTGKRVTVISASRERSATALYIDEDCRLCVEYDDGARESLHSGEVGIKL